MLIDTGKFFTCPLKNLKHQLRQLIQSTGINQEVMMMMIAKSLTKHASFDLNQDLFLVIALYSLSLTSH